MIDTKNGPAVPEELSTDEIKRFIELAEANLNRARQASHRSVQKALQNLADTVRMFRESKIPVNLEAPEFAQPLNELGLTLLAKPVSVRMPQGSRGSDRYSAEELEVIKTNVVQRMVALNGQSIKLVELFRGLPVTSSSRTGWMTRVKWPEGYVIAKRSLGQYALVKK